MGQVQGELKQSAFMIIGDLVKKIQNMFQIQNISLIVKQNGVDIELNTQEYQKKTLQQVAINDCEVLTVQEKQNRIDLIIKYKEKGVSLQMLIGDLVSQIQNKLHIQNISLFVNQNGQDIDLNSYQYQMQTLQQAGIQDQQTITVQDNFEQELKIYILYGPEPIILNHKCYLQKTTIQDLKLKVEQHLSLSPYIAQNILDKLPLWRYPQTGLNTQTRSRNHQALQKLPRQIKLQQELNIRHLIDSILKLIIYILGRAHLFSLNQLPKQYQTVLIQVIILFQYCLVLVDCSIFQLWFPQKYIQIHKQCSQFWNMVRVFILCQISFQFIIKYLLTIWISLLLEFLSFEIFELISIYLLFYYYLSWTSHSILFKEDSKLRSCQMVLGDIAGYLNEEKYTQSLNIGIYSQNKKYYTDNQDEQLINIGTGSGDTYLILEGDLKDQYDPKVIQRGIVIYLYINIDGNITKEKIIVNLAMKICELISLIQTNYHIKDVQLLKKKNWVDIELHLPKYQMQTLEEVGVKKQQTFQVSGNSISTLNIYIVDGPLGKIFNLTLNISTATLYDIKISVETYISVISNLPNEFFQADIYINDRPYNGQKKLIKPLKQLNVSKKTKIEARIRYIG